MLILKTSVGCISMLKVAIAWIHGLPGNLAKGACELVPKLAAAFYEAKDGVHGIPRFKAVSLWVQSPSLVKASNICERIFR